MLTRVRADDTSFLDAVLDGVFTARGEAHRLSGVLAELAAVDTKAGWLSRLNGIPKRLRPPVYVQLGFVQLGAAAARARLAMQQR